MCVLVCVCVCVLVCAYVCMCVWCACVSPALKSTCVVVAAGGGERQPSVRQDGVVHGPH